METATHDQSVGEVAEAKPLASCTFKLPAELYDQVCRRALAEDRSVAYVVRQALKRMFNPPHTAGRRR
jgi:hypothetical protein